MPKKESDDASMKDANDDESENASNDEFDSDDNQHDQPAAAHEKFTSLHYAVQAYAHFFLSFDIFSTPL